MRLVIRAEDAPAGAAALPSSMTRTTAYAAICTVALVAFSVAAVAGLWIAPQTLGVSTPEAYAQFGGGSIFGIVMYAGFWTLWSAGSLVFVLARVRKSDAWVRAGRHRYISLLGSSVMVGGLIALGAWTLWLEVDLAAEHVAMDRDRDPFVPIIATSMYGFFAIVGALFLGAIGAVIDRVAGKAPFLVA